MARPVDLLRQVAPKALPSYLKAFDVGDSLLQQHQLTTPDRFAYFLSQVLHESGGLTIEHESMNYSAERLLEIFGVGRHSAAITSAEAVRLAHNEQAIAERVYGIGNPHKAQELENKEPGDGFKYRGGGLMQTTGRCNYRRIGDVCGADFEENPDLVFSAEHALKPALVEWSESGLNVYADNKDILAISRAINCGSPKSKAFPNGMQSRATWFAKVRPLIDRVDFSITQAGEVAAEKQTTVTQPMDEPGLDSTECVAELLGERILRPGDEGPLVRAVQLALARLGYPLRGTGSFAGRTLDAVMDFQRAHGLELDGEIGEETGKAIDRALAERSTASAATGAALAGLVGDRILRFGDSDSTVQAVQLGLARLGYPLKGTGNFGPATEQAVRDFQTRHALEVDGEVGSEVAGAIDRALAALVPPAESSSQATPTRASPGVLTGMVGNSVLAMGDEGSTVHALQLALAKLGYPLKGTGYFGGATEAAVTDFQDQHGLESDGEVGLETARAVDQALAGPQPATEGPHAEEAHRPLPTTDTRPLWVIEGLNWLNLREAPGAADNPVILEWAREEGGEIARDYTHDDIPWCSLFANMVLTKVEIKGTETLWALDWDKWGQKLPGPSVGAFAPMKREGGGHIAIVVGRDARGNLMCLGGNQSDSVSIIPFPAYRPLSFRWPLGVSLPLKTDIQSLPLMGSDGRVSTKES